MQTTSGHDQHVLFSARNRMKPFLVMDILTLLSGIFLFSNCWCRTLGLCGTCDITPLVGFENKRVTGGVMWTNTTFTSLTQCAVRCALFPTIKSFGYSQSTGECVAYNTPATSPYTTETGFNMYSSCPPVDGGVSAWGSWGSKSCSETCGNPSPGILTRTRSCTNPSPANGGASCTETLSDTKSDTCNLIDCPVDGGVSAWGLWTVAACSVTCGQFATYTESRTRTCSNPAPAHGGNNCSENLVEITPKSCHLPSCPVHFGSCNGSADCTVVNTTCNDGWCVCDIMHQYSSGSCVQGCATYGSDFTTFIYMVLNGYNTRLIRNVTTIEACMSACIAETGFMCITADYQYLSSDCYLSSSATYEVPLSRIRSHIYYHEFIRNCA
ncbi:uncharacterized protein [Haliotis cracherodii]|uniref:uncharacterized protein n=1 Tax=Haliotis cracherodii TaxID=6455 RepID=UPI0039E75F08